MCLPTLQDIATELGLTKAAVSLALRGQPGVSERTRQRVQETAARLGYVPDPAVSSLAEQRWRGRQRKLVLPWAFLATSLPSVSVYQGELTSAIERHTNAHGYSFNLVQLEPETTARSLNRQLRALSIKGVILDRIIDRHLLMDWDAVAWNKFVWVSVNEGLFSPPTHRVLYNTLAKTQSALHKVVERGYRRIAFIREDDRLSRNNVRQHAAFLQFQVAHPDIAMKDFGVERPAMLDTVAEEVTTFAPDALLLGYTSIHKRLPGHLQAIPWASLALWHPEAEGLGDRVAGIVLSSEELAAAAVDMLDFNMRRRENGLPKRRHTLLVEGHWQDGASLPPKKPGSQ